MKLGGLLLELLNSTLTEEIERLVINVGCLLDVKQEGDLSPLRQYNFVLLLDFEVFQLLC